VTEMVENSNGEPYWFVADHDELREALDAIPDDVLVEANERPWTRQGLEPPQRTVGELRQRLLERHEQAPRRMRPTPSGRPERVLPIEEAARHLGLTGRVLRYRIQQGEYADAKRELRGGGIGLAFKPPGKSWSLVVERPDPRIVMQMVRDRVEPGQQYHPGYTRRADGENWREASRW
jgi:hypothetical protein